VHTCTFVVHIVCRGAHKNRTCIILTNTPPVYLYRFTKRGTMNVPRIRIVGRIISTLEMGRPALRGTVGNPTRHLALAEIRSKQMRRSVDTDVSNRNYVFGQRNCRLVSELCRTILENNNSHTTETFKNRCGRNFETSRRVSTAASHDPRARLGSRFWAARARQGSGVVPPRSCPRMCPQPHPIKVLTFFQAKL
jgi:hypothetical protein